MSLQKKATVFLAILVGAVLVRNAAGAIIQSQGSDAQGHAQAAQLLETNEKQFAIGLLNQETGVRGFELTGQSQYLQPYLLGTSQVTAARRFLDSAPPDPSTRAKLTAMEDAADNWQAFAGIRLAAATASGPSSNANTDQEGKRLFDTFRAAELDVSASLDRTVKLDIAAAGDLATAGNLASLVGTVAILSLIAFLAGV